MCDHGFDEQSDAEGSHEKWDTFYLHNQHPSRWLMLPTGPDREAFEALRHTLEVISRVDGDPYYWKWTLIALHNAVQAFMVLALEGSWPVRTYKDHQAERLLAAREEQMANPQMFGRKLGLHDLGSFDHFLEDVPIRKKKRRRPPEPDELRLEEFLGLYEDIRDPDQMGDYYHMSQAFVPEDHHTVNMERLNELRNIFIHFIPQGFMDYIGDYPEIVEDSLDVISFLAFESNMPGTLDWAHDPALRAPASEVIAAIRVEAENLAVAYTAT